MMGVSINGKDERKTAIKKLPIGVDAPRESRVFDIISDSGDRSAKPAVLRGLQDMINYSGDISVFTIERMVASLVLKSSGITQCINQDARFRTFCENCVIRFLSDDWGDLCKEDWTLNEERNGYALGAYSIPEILQPEGERKIYIINDGVAITLCFPIER